MNSEIKWANLEPEIPVATRVEEAAWPVGQQVTVEERLAHLAVRRFFESVKSGNAPLVKRITLRKVKTEKGTPMVIASGIVPIMHVACANPEEV